MMFFLFSSLHVLLFCAVPSGMEEVAAQRSALIANINAMTAVEVESAPHIDGELMVRFHPCGFVMDEESPDKTLQYATFTSKEVIARFHELGTKGEVEDATCLLKETGFSVIQFINPPEKYATNKVLSQIGVLAHVVVPPHMSMQAARDLLLGMNEVEYVSLVHTYEFQSFPNDPLFDQQWSLHNTGQVPPCETTLSGTPFEDINVMPVWDITTGSSDVIVAVIDSGVMLEHPDLTDSNIVEGLNFEAWTGDLFGHGTYIIGIIAASGDNGIGVTGIAWDTTVMSYTMGASNLNSANLLLAFEHLVEEGATVVNASWGTRQWNDGAMYDHLLFLRDEGVLFVAAAGNNGWDNDAGSPIYPASFPLDNIISVAATDHFGTLTPFSNWGVNSVDIAAPGWGIRTVFNDGDYACPSGTSAAAPAVVGAVALIHSIYPNVPYTGKRNALLFSAKQLSSLQGLIATGGRLDVAATFLWLSNADVDQDLDYDLFDLSNHMNCFGSTQLSCIESTDLTNDELVDLWDWEVVLTLVTGP